ncbi:TlpA family protein disulfide reductase [Solicola gregarius]|uniref:TlpA family protein disulfide reductase n=1 Tax=Solicola gregarius TaxID=2908642 RepID=A0AA46TNR3_9ACTN|nr:TlpA disulfide reductase family protein [Solicola gregarius]UYM07763.1 TlpA family protein disulfide reductase [Solicola gregarius]
MRWAGAAIAAATCLLGTLAACAPPTSSDDEGGGGSLPASQLSDVDVDTPELANLKRAAGIDDCPQLDGGVAPVDDGLPDVTLPCLGGGPDVKLSALRGKPTLINVWASWCEPCRRELPVIQQLHESGKVRVIGIDIEDPQPDTAIELAADSGVTYPSMADPGGDSKPGLLVATVPQTVFVDDQGRIAGTARKEYSSYEMLAADVREHLGVRP